MGTKKGKEQPRVVNLDTSNLVRLAHNFLMERKKGQYSLDELDALNEYLIGALQPREFTKYKVGVMIVCVNEMYWQYMKPVVDDIKRLFLPGHDTELMIWSDLHKLKSLKEAYRKAIFNPEASDQDVATDFIKAYALASQLQSPILNNVGQSLTANGLVIKGDGQKYWMEVVGQTVFPRAEVLNIADTLLSATWTTDMGTTMFDVDSMEWPYPTLMRYHYFLEQEEYLKKFDYLFYIDLDMRVVNVVGDEILGKGLTAAQHPMYALSPNLWYPYEPNPESSAYIKTPGRLTIGDKGKPVFQPLYAAGGLQGGTTEEFIKAMRWMKQSTDKDFTKNYIARWNDESHWNRYLFDNPPDVVLSPAYVHPDSMVAEYYNKIWGRSYTPRIITLTKPFTTSKEGGAAAAEMMNKM